MIHPAPRQDPPRTILVTGGTGALGTAVTRRLLDDGHRVAATWVVKEEAEALRETIGPTERLALFETDVTDEGSMTMPDADFDAWVATEDVAASISFLTSQEAGQLRGAWVPVYGSV